VLHVITDRKRGAGCLTGFGSRQGQIVFSTLPGPDRFWGTPSLRWKGLKLSGRDAAEDTNALYLHDNVSLHGVVLKVQRKHYG
jgi:hypothetical protein